MEANEDYTFWSYKEIKKGKPVLKWKGSIVALKDFFNKKIRCETNWNYIEARPKKPATWRLKESGLMVVWYPSTNTLCFQGEEGDRIKSTVLPMLETEDLSQHEYEDDSSNVSELSNFSITDPPCLFQTHRYLIILRVLWILQTGMSLFVRLQRHSYSSGPLNISQSRHVFRLGKRHLEVNILIRTRLVKITLRSRIKQTKRRKIKTPAESPYY